jgi:hypothetical protein
VGAVTRLLRDEPARHALGVQAAAVYASEFSLQRTVEVLRESAPCGVAEASASGFRALAGRKQSRIPPTGGSTCG